MSRGAGGVVAVATWLLAACHGAPGQAPDATAPDAGVVGDAGVAPAVVPWTTAPVTIDGDWTEGDWNAVATQYIFTDRTGAQARPYSEVRVMRDHATLYLGLYAADEDIHTTDFFQVTLGAVDIRINPRGVVTASAPGIVAASDVDGTVDHAGDYDEEWLIEAAVPLAAIASPEGVVTLAASRCDVTTDGVLRCGAMAATLATAAPDGK